LPFGESMANQRITESYSSRYTFTGKEQDALTGLHYFGARYYDARISLWYGVDPLTEKYPEWNPYNYTLNNPIKYTDPDGRESEEAIDGGGDPKKKNQEKKSISQVPPSTLSYKVTDTNLSTRNSNSNLSSNDLNETLGKANDVLSFADPVEALVGATQLGFIDKRKQVPFGHKIGTFSKFQTRYSSLAMTRGLIGKAGNAGDILSLGINYKDYREGEITGSRLGFRSIGTLSSFGMSVYIGSQYSGPWGAIAGGTTSIGFTVAEMLYDGTMFMKKEVSKVSAQWENAIRSGWIPR
jgi:RHS repeat-associated protein